DDRGGRLNGHRQRGRRRRGVARDIDRHRGEIVDAVRPGRRRERPRPRAVGGGIAQQRTPVIYLDGAVRLGRANDCRRLGGGDVVSGGSPVVLSGRQRHPRRRLHRRVDGQGKDRRGAAGVGGGIGRLGGEVVQPVSQRGGEGDAPVAAAVGLGGGSQPHVPV